MRCCMKLHGIAWADMALRGSQVAQVGVGWSTLHPCIARLFHGHTGDLRRPGIFPYKSIACTLTQLYTI